MNDTRFYDRILGTTIVCLALVIALVLSACSPGAAVQTPAPVVQPTPQVIEVTPPACGELFSALADGFSIRNQALIDIYKAYLDYPDEDLTDFGRRVEAIMDTIAEEIDRPFQFITREEYEALVIECLGSTPGPGAGAES